MSNIASVKKNSALKVCPNCGHDLPSRIGGTTTKKCHKCEHIFPSRIGGATGGTTGGTTIKCHNCGCGIEIALLAESRPDHKKKRSRKARRSLGFEHPKPKRQHRKSRI